jgi:hypothetical protein
MMKQLFDQFIGRPLMALISSVEILREELQAEQTVDGVLSRAIHILSCPPNYESDSEREKSRKRSSRK